MDTPCLAVKIWYTFIVNHSINPAAKPRPSTKSECSSVIMHISANLFTNRQDSATIRRTDQKSKTRGGCEFETDIGQGDVGL